MKCEEGLLAIADTRITSGTETSVARKIAVHQGDEHCLFILAGASDVDPPLDSALYLRDSFRVREHRFEAADLEAVSSFGARPCAWPCTTPPAGGAAHGATPGGRPLP